MNAREEMLARVRRAAPAAGEPQPLPELPAFASPTQAHPGSFEDFAAALLRMGGRLAGLGESGKVAARVHALFPDARVVASASAQVAGTLALGGLPHPRDLADVDVAVVRSPLGVAETGSVLLTERELGVEALGFLAQHLVVLLDPACIVATLHDAYQHPAFKTARYTILMTGPSATADIEGVLIHGAQGVRSLTVLACVERAD